MRLGSRRAELDGGEARDEEAKVGEGFEEGVDEEGVEVATALFASVRSMECGTATELLLDATITEAKQRLLDRYQDDRWTWRR